MQQDAKAKNTMTTDHRQIDHQNLRGNTVYCDQSNSERNFPGHSLNTNILHSLKRNAIMDLAFVSIDAIV